MTKKRYYWSNSQSLEPGSIVNPGNWGRVIKNTPGHTLGFLEAVFELVRTQNYKMFPSRLESNFLCDTVEDIKKFKNDTKRQADTLYEVEIVDGGAPMLYTDWNLITIGLSWNDTEKLAHKYYGSKDNKKTEILTLSAIKIIKRVEG